MKIEKTAVDELLKAKIGDQHQIIGFIRRDADIYPQRGDIYKALEDEHNAVITALTELLGEVEAMK